MSDFLNLKLESNEGVATLTFNRPEKLNALNAATLAELETALVQLAADASVKGLIVTGAGEKAFVAGADISEFKAAPLEGRSLAERGQRIFGSLEQLGKPVIAAINGFALGGGCELALACHVRVAAEHARLGTPEVKLGIMCGYGGSQRLPRLVGKGRALEMLLTGEMIDAAEAYRIGLVNRVIPKERLLAEAEALLRKMIANGPIALRHTLEAVNAGLQLPLAEALQLESALFGLLCGTEDMQIGTRAFLERRPAEFKGR